jgi:3-methyl-2-oxobutanoate hydroxymethyltransferase
VKLSAPQIRGRKRRTGAAPLVMVTAYDEPGARLAAAAGVDIILVGDSLANVVLGHDDTLHLSVEDMCHHVRAVAAAKPDLHVVADMPWLSYHLSVADSVANAALLIRSGADSVKLEGGRVRREVVRAILDAEIPVMAHLGLTPQSVMAFGGFKVQAKTREAAQQLQLDAKILQDEGVFAVVVEGVPSVVGTDWGATSRRSLCASTWTSVRSSPRRSLTSRVTCARASSPHPMRRTPTPTNS